MKRPLVPTLASALIIMTLALVPSAVAASAPEESRCVSSVHTIQVVCGHETLGYYLDCYLYRNVITKWGDCL